MKYYEVKFSILPSSETAQDILSALLAETGFESFVPDATGITGYVQQNQWNKKAVEDLIEDFPLAGVTLSYAIVEAPNENWNQAWEDEGFNPVYLKDRVCIHDTKHTTVNPCKYDILINPRMAFGTGTHPTTQMMLETLTEIDLEGKRVVDAGCGTGVLGILAIKRGAAEVLAYDIDEWSTQNATENFHINGIANGSIIQGDSAVLKNVENYDVFIANINRNILLADMKQFVSALRKDGQLILSGFYTSDANLLLEESQKYGKKLIEKKESNEWCLLRLG